MTTGNPDRRDSGLNFSCRLVDGPIARGIRPIATLYHWDLFQPPEDAGGWSNCETAYRVHTGTALNESWRSADLGYGSGAPASDRTHGADTAAAVHRALAGGVDGRGQLGSCLLDKFEWGMAPASDSESFGLTMARWNTRLRTAELGILNWGAPAASHDARE